MRRKDLYSSSGTVKIFLESHVFKYNKITCKGCLINVGYKVGFMLKTLKSQGCKWIISNIGYQLKELADTLNLTVSQVRNWFQNKRVSYKKKCQLELLNLTGENAKIWPSNSHDCLKLGKDQLLPLPFGIPESGINDSTPEQHSVGLFFGCNSSASKPKKPKHKNKVGNDVFNQFPTLGRSKTHTPHGPFALPVPSSPIECHNEREPPNLAVSAGHTTGGKNDCGLIDLGCYSNPSCPKSAGHDGKSQSEVVQVASFPEAPDADGASIIGSPGGTPISTPVPDGTHSNSSTDLTVNSEGQPKSLHSTGYKQPTMSSDKESSADPNALVINSESQPKSLHSTGYKQPTMSSDTESSADPKALVINSDSQSDSLKSTSSNEDPAVSFHVYIAAKNLVMNKESHPKSLHSKGYKQPTMSSDTESSADPKALVINSDSQSNSVKSTSSNEHPAVSFDVYIAAKNLVINKESHSNSLPSAVYKQPTMSDAESSGDPKALVINSESHCDSFNFTGSNEQPMVSSDVESWVASKNLVMNKLNSTGCNEHRTELSERRSLLDSNSLIVKSECVTDALNTTGYNNQNNDSLSSSDMSGTNYLESSEYRSKTSSPFDMEECLVPKVDFPSVGAGEIADLNQNSKSTFRGKSETSFENSSSSESLSDTSDTTSIERANTLPCTHDVGDSTPFKHSALSSNTTQSNTDAEFDNLRGDQEQKHKSHFVVRAKEAGCITSSRYFKNENNADIVPTCTPAEAIISPEPPPTLNLGTDDPPNDRKSPDSRCANVNKTQNSSECKNKEVNIDLIQSVAGEGSSTSVEPSAKSSKMPIDTVAEDMIPPGHSTVSVDIICNVEPKFFNVGLTTITSIHTADGLNKKRKSSVETSESASSSPELKKHEKEFLDSKSEPQTTDKNDSNLHEHAKKILPSMSWYLRPKVSKLDANEDVSINYQHQKGKLGGVERNISAGSSNPSNDPFHSQKEGFLSPNHWPISAVAHGNEARFSSFTPVHDVNDLSAIESDSVRNSSLCINQKQDPSVHTTTNHEPVTGSSNPTPPVMNDSAVLEAYKVTTSSPKSSSSYLNQKHGEDYITQNCGVFSRDRTTESNSTPPIVNSDYSNLTGYTNFSSYLYQRHNPSFLALRPVSESRYLRPSYVNEWAALESYNGTSAVTHGHSTRSSNSAPPPYEKDSAALESYGATDSMNLPIYLDQNQDCLTSNGGAATRATTTGSSSLMSSAYVNNLSALKPYDGTEAVSRGPITGSSDLAAYPDANGSADPYNLIGFGNSSWYLNLKQKQRFFTQYCGTVTRGRTARSSDPAPPHVDGSSPQESNNCARGPIKGSSYSAVNSSGESCNITGSIKSKLNNGLSTTNCGTVIQRSTTESSNHALPPNTDNYAFEPYDGTEAVSRGPITGSSDPAAHLDANGSDEPYNFTGSGNLYINRKEKQRFFTQYCGTVTRGPIAGSSDPAPPLVDGSSSLESNNWSRGPIKGSSYSDANGSADPYNLPGFGNSKLNNGLSGTNRETVIRGSTTESSNRALPPNTDNYAFEPYDGTEAVSRGPITGSCDPAAYPDANGSDEPYNFTGSGNLYMNRKEKQRFFTQYCGTVTRGPIAGSSDPAPPLVDGSSPLESSNRGRGTIKGSSYSDANGSADPYNSTGFGNSPWYINQKQKERYFTQYCGTVTRGPTAGSSDPDPPHVDGSSPLEPNNWVRGPIKGSSYSAVNGSAESCNITDSINSKLNNGLSTTNCGTLIRGSTTQYSNHALPHTDNYTLEPYNGSEAVSRGPITGSCDPAAYPDTNGSDEPYNFTGSGNLYINRKEKQRFFTQYCGTVTRGPIAGPSDPAPPLVDGSSPLESNNCARGPIKGSSYSAVNSSAGSCNITGSINSKLNNGLSTTNCGTVIQRSTTESSNHALPHSDNYDLESYNGTEAGFSNPAPPMLSYPTLETYSVTSSDSFSAYKNQKTSQDFLTRAYGAVAHGPAPGSSNSTPTSKRSATAALDSYITGSANSSRYISEKQNIGHVTSMLPTDPHGSASASSDAASSCGINEMPAAWLTSGTSASNSSNHYQKLSKGFLATLYPPLPDFTRRKALEPSPVYSNSTPDHTSQIGTSSPTGLMHQKQNDSYVIPMYPQATDLTTSMDREAGPIYNNLTVAVDQTTSQRYFDSDTMLVPPGYQKQGKALTGPSYTPVPDVNELTPRGLSAVASPPPFYWDKESNINNASGHLYYGSKHATYQPVSEKSENGSTSLHDVDYEMRDEFENSEESMLNDSFWPRNSSTPLYNAGVPPERWPSVVNGANEFPDNCTTGYNMDPYAGHHPLRGPVMGEATENKDLQMADHFIPTHAPPPYVTYGPQSAWRTVKLAEQPLDLSHYGWPSN